MNCWMDAQVARKGQKKQTEFAEGFEFPVDGGERITWDMNEAMDMAIKGQVGLRVCVMGGCVSLCAYGCVFVCVMASVFVCLCA